MPFRYAVIRHDANGWQVHVNDYAQDLEETAKTSPEILKHTQRLIDQTQEATPCQPDK